jgi:hypothetical protein
MKEAAKNRVLNQVQSTGNSNGIERNEQNEEMAISGFNAVNNNENADFQGSENWAIQDSNL